MSDYLAFMFRDLNAHAHPPRKTLIVATTINGLRQSVVVSVRNVPMAMIAVQTTSKANNIRTPLEFRGWLDCV